MPKFAANLTMLFQELPFLQRFDAARKAGFDYVEYLFPYAWKAEQLNSCLQDNDLKQVLFNLPPGNWEAGERGIACHPERISEFREGVDKAIEYANVLQVKQLNCLSGLRPQHATETTLRDTLLENLEYAAGKLGQHGINLLIEAINSRVDMPGFYLDTLDAAIEVLETLKLPNLKIQFDLYHMQIMHGDLSRRIEQNLDQIAHIQFADNPGRHEPGTGEINFRHLFGLLDELGYKGWVSAEYLPKTTTSASLDWLQTFN